MSEALLALVSKPKVKFCMQRSVVFDLLERGGLLLAVLTPHYLATWGL
jgi:hypothetical protein